MQLITFAEAVSINFKKSAGALNLQFEASRDYVLPLPTFNRLMAEQAVANRVFKLSRIENRIPNFNVNVKKNSGSQRLLIYNGSGGYGDQIMTWPFARILTDLGFEVHVLADPGNHTCWWNFPWIKTILNMPISYELFKMFDYWALFEAVVNTDEHQDQCHPLDVMLNKVGIDPNSIDPARKRVRPNFTWLEQQSTALFNGKRIAMYQLCSATAIRCLPPNDSAFLLTKIADAYPDIHWLALYDEFNKSEYIKALQCNNCEGKTSIQVPDITLPTTGTCAPGQDPQTAMAAGMAKAMDEAPKKQAICPKCQGSGTLRPNIQLYSAPVLRELWALATRCAVIVSPDSMMVHVAGTMDIPCVGLWGVTNPESRVRYYKNHIAIYKRDACRFSPCFAYAGAFPKYCPPRPNRNVCECLGAISPPDVIEAIKTFIPQSTPQPTNANA